MKEKKNQKTPTCAELLPTETAKPGKRRRTHLLNDPEISPQSKLGLQAGGKTNVREKQR